MLSRLHEDKGKLITRDLSEAQPHGTEVFVDHGEIAAIVRDSKVVGVLPPGRHVLDVARLAFLQAVAEAGHFRSTVTFVTVAPVADCGFSGTANIKDQSGARAHAKFFGRYTLRVADPARFIDDMVGSKGTDERVRAWAADKLSALVQSCLGEWVRGGYFTIDTASTAGPQLAQAVAPRCADFAEYGLELVRIDSVAVRTQ